MLTSRDVMLIPFSLFWCGFVVFWIWSASKAGGAFWLFGVPFLFVGLYFVAGRFIFDAWVRAGTIYGLTAGSAMILRTRPSMSFTTVALGRASDVQLSETAAGRGTIRFGATAPMWGNRGWSAWTPSLDPTPQFLGIDGAREVFNLVQRAGARSL
jgi:hypothetical protein